MSRDTQACRTQSARSDRSPAQAAVPTAGRGAARTCERQEASRRQGSHQPRPCIVEPPFSPARCARPARAVDARCHDRKEPRRELPPWILRPFLRSRKAIPRSSVHRVHRASRRDLPRMMSPSMDPLRHSRTPWERPVFALTADQDWAPAWASEQLLAVVATLGMPLHVFRTNPCPVLDDAFAQGRITQGWHPNFLPGSDHGDSSRAGDRLLPHAFSGLSHCQGPLLHGAHHGLGRPRRVGDRRRFPASDLLPGRPRPTPARVRHLAASGLLRGRHLLSRVSARASTWTTSGRRSSALASRFSTSIPPSSPRTSRLRRTTPRSRRAGSRHPAIIRSWSTVAAAPGKCSRSLPC